MQSGRRARAGKAAPERPSRTATKRVRKPQARRRVASEWVWQKSANLGPSEACSSIHSSIHECREPRPLVRRFQGLHLTGRRASREKRETTPRSRVPVHPKSEKFAIFAGPGGGRQRPRRCSPLRAARMGRDGNACELRVFCEPVRPHPVQGARACPRLKAAERVTTGSDPIKKLRGDDRSPGRVRRGPGPTGDEAATTAGRPCGSILCGFRTAMARRQALGRAASPG